MNRLDEADPLYQLYLPLTYNDGRLIEEVKFDITRKEIVARFGGLTNTPPGFPLQGWWQSAGAVLRDDILVWTVLTQGDENGYFHNYKEVLKDRFAQDEIFIVKIPAEAL
jgi:hypothetical protein